jgi:formylmethanofuran dehydrogenase subunit C
MKRQRGSAMMLVMVLVLCTTTIIAASVDLSLAAFRYQKRTENATRFKYMKEAAIAHVLSLQVAGSLTLPSSVSRSIGGVTCTISVKQNPKMSRTLEITTSAKIDGTVHESTDIVGARILGNPWHYVLSVFATPDIKKATTLGSMGSNGDLFIKGDASGFAGNISGNGDIEVTGTIDRNKVSTTGTLWEKATGMNEPSIKTSDYLSVSYTSLGTNINGRTFVSFIPGKNQLLIVTGNASIKGTFTGKGTILVLGNVTLDGNMMYGSPTSTVAILATGNIIVNPSVTTFCGFFYTDGNFEFRGNGSKTLSKGAIVCKGFVSDSPLTLHYDPLLWNDSSQGAAFYLPGYWP